MPPPKATPKLKVPPLLPPLPRLRIRRTNNNEANPCTGVMTAVLGCWASYGHASANCAELEQSLRACMDQPRVEPATKTNLNFHLGRLQDRYTDNHKKNKKRKK